MMLNKQDFMDVFFIVLDLYRKEMEHEHFSSIQNYVEMLNICQLFISDRNNLNGTITETNYQKCLQAFLHIMNRKDFILSRGYIYLYEDE